MRYTKLYKTVLKISGNRCYGVMKFQIYSPNIVNRHSGDQERLTTVSVYSHL